MTERRPGCAGRGELWTWGDADGGKLGHGADAAKEKAVVAPRRVRGLDENADVTTVSCGQRHATRRATTASCGSAAAGKVLLAEPALEPRARSATYREARRRSRVASGTPSPSRGAARRCTRGAAWQARRALQSRGGRDEHAPRAVEALAGRRVHHVACGPESTAAVVSSRSMTVQERAGLTKKKDLALNFGTQPSQRAENIKGLRRRTRESRRTPPGTPSRGGSSRGPSGGGGAHHHALARVQPGRITAATADGATTAAGHIAGRWENRRRGPDSKPERSRDEASEGGGSQRHAREGPARSR